MSIEVVTAPKNGVTVSTAGYTTFAGHKLCFTFDAIRKDSPADYSLSKEMYRESSREDVLYWRSDNRTNKSFEKKSVSKSQTPWFSFSGPDLSSVIKKTVQEKMEKVASVFHSFIETKK